VASGPPGSGSFSPVFLSQPDPSPRTSCSASSVADRARRLRVAASQRQDPSPFLSLYLSLSPFYSSLLSKRKLLPPPAIAVSSDDKVPRPSVPPRSRQKGARTPPLAPRDHHPTQDPWSRLEIKFFPPSFRALPPPHGSLLSSKLPAATSSASSGSPRESHSLVRAGQPQLPSRCRTTMEAIPSSELLCHPRRTLVLHECRPNCC
jgi:hypothetical protein